MKNGNIYIGNFLNGNIYGEGEMCCKNGDIYRGSFNGNYFDGFLVKKNGRKIRKKGMIS